MNDTVNRYKPTI